MKGMIMNKRGLIILSVIFFALSPFAPTWGQTNSERCIEAYNAKDYTDALPACKEAAEQGNSGAQFLLGGMYYYGLAVNQDYAESFVWFRKSGEQGDPVAQCYLGWFYYYGKGVPKDYIEAEKWYRKAAEQGHAEAQYGLGSCYERGHGVKQDYSEAIKLYQAAAKQGHMKAQLALGVIYTNGTGVERDYQEAVKYYQMAAKTGDSSALLALGYMYINGYGVPKDQIQALMYWEISSAQGNAAAISTKKSILNEMSSLDISNAQKKAKEWLYNHGLPSERVGSVTDSDRMRTLDIAKDGKITIEWDSGKGETVGYVDKETGKLIKIKNPITGEIGDIGAVNLDLLKKLAEAGDSNSQYELAKKYVTGDGVEKNHHQAEKWLIHSILNDFKNQKSIELIEKEFGWHCILSEDNRCTNLINKASITHDKNLSWYWKIGLMKTEINKKIAVVILRTYDVMTCNNRTAGYKTIQVLDYDLHVVPNKNLTVTDDKIEFKPLEPNTYNDRLFNYVCVPTTIGKKEEDIQEVSFGTGWPIQPGYIVTNQHVVSGKKNIMIVSTSGEKSPAKVLIEDKLNDLVILDVDHPEKLPPTLPIAKSSAKTGMKVFTIGYPHPDIMGTKPKLSEGIVNALSGYMDDPRILQISVPVQAGNSGGPLLNMNGEVVGIVTAKLSAVKMFNWTGDLPQNVNYAVKATYITALLDSAMAKLSIWDMAGFPKIKNLPPKPANLESLSSRIQDSVLLIIAE
jgi:TPR repeat protein/S1-C subfamily serine protease